MRPFMAPLKSDFNGAVEERLQLLAHVVGIFPIVGGASGVLGVGTDEGAIFYTSDVIGIGASVEAPRPELFVELDKRAAGDHLLAELIVFFL